MSVVIYHVIEIFKWTAFPSAGPLLWFRIGWMGVDLFFVISGFVIALSTFELIDALGPIAFRQPYIRRRLSRILPLHYLTCLIFIAFVSPQLMIQNTFFINLISHLGFIHNLSWRTSGALNGQNWSIGNEMQFYLLILILAPFLRRCKWWLIPAVALPIAWAWRFGAFSMVPIDANAGPYYRFWAVTQLPGTLDQFAIGVLLARLVRSTRCRKFIQTLQQRPWIIFLAAAGAVWLMLAVYWPLASFWEIPLMVVFWRTLESSAFGLVVLAACSLTGKTLISISKPLRYFGTISYGIYLWHLSVLLSVKDIKGLPIGTALLMIVVLTCLLASASWHFFEKPLLRK